jgi:branched-chain amino acid transport system permease protein
MPAEVLQLLITGLVLGGIYALISVSLTLIFGVLRIVNFAHGEFLMLAMYFTYWLFTLLGLDPYLSLPIVLALMFVVGAITHLLVIRPILNAPPITQVFATVGVGLVLSNLALLFWKGDYRTVTPPYGSATIQILDARLSVPGLVAFAGALGTAVLLSQILRRTYFGKSIIATAQDRAAARLMGIDVERVYFLTFAIGIALVGVAGVLLMPIYYVHPHIGTTFALVAFVVVVLGGLGSLPGAVAGGLLIGLVETTSGFLLPSSMKQAAYFVIFMVVLALRPAGLFGRRGAEEFGLK